MEEGTVQERTFKNYTAKWEFLSEDQLDKLEDYSLKVNFYKDDKFLYALEKNNYRTEYDDFVLLEWFEQADGRTVFLFNLTHSVISVIDADTGKEIHHDNLFDMFISEYQMFDNREYMYVSGWFWSPVPVRVIYHIPSLLTTPGYQPINISCYGQTNHCHPSIDLYGCDTAKEFLDQKDKIFEDMRLRDETNLFNSNRSGETLLKLFLNSDEVIFDGDSKEILSGILSKDQEVFYIRTWGNVSGKHLANYDKLLYQEILYTENDEKAAIPKNIPLPNPEYQGSRCKVCLEPELGGYCIEGGIVCVTCYEVVKHRSNAIRSETSISDPLCVLVPKIFIPGFITNLPIEEYNLRFEMHSEVSGLIINYHQELTWNGNESMIHDGGKRRCDVDPTKGCTIRIYKMEN